MNVLVIGSGGREHAICAAFRRSPRVEKLFCANGNAGIAAIAECVPIRHDEAARLVQFASENSVDMTFVGGETPLALGVVDEFEKRGLRIIGPRRDAARLESSKAFAKDFMARHGVPTARYVTAHSAGFAILELESGDFGGPDAPVVVKADGLAAGKGVVVARDRAEAADAINTMASLVGTAAAEKIVLEECLVGREVSLLAFVDGESYALMPATRDHKRIGDGDSGPNTGGMGAITDASLLTGEQLAEIEQTIIRPTLAGCEREDISFRGILFLGLMMTAAGPRVLEYNIRFGDPETQAILVRLDTDLLDICDAMLAGTLGDMDIRWRPGSSACIVLASENYPSMPRTGDVISGVAEASAAPNVQVFHAGTTDSPDGSIVTSGGRVLGVTATGATLDESLATAYSAVEKISWPGMQYRRDIGK
ncbi:MAG: phosphoribosylamine--glycine ligase [Chloracidobacterium sp.]|nr:phosphoribosylamine--glycine ligase [Chloracidobacterium sp.]